MEIDDKDSFKHKKLNSYTECIAIRAKINMKATAEDMVIDESNGPILEIKPSRKEDNGLNSKHSVKDELKAHAMHLVNAHPKNSARTIALEFKLPPRNVHRWSKAWEEGSDSFFEKLGRPRITEPDGKRVESTKKLVSDFYYKYSTATVDQLTIIFIDLRTSKSTVYHYLTDLWIFSFKKVQMEPIERNISKKIQERKE